MADVSIREMEWIGPFTIDELLDNLPENNLPMPPDDNAVYLVTRMPWEEEPRQDCLPLYVGTTTGKTARFRTRVGDLIIDAFGFFDQESGHSSGGNHLYEYCKKEGINPKVLYISWVINVNCKSCTERELYNTLNPILNMIPPRCNLHLEN
ncbi:MAG: hypothetical protein ACTSUE_17775 [Promethearchaeota archaeon]